MSRSPSPPAQTTAPRHTLCLVSHARSPPLHPEPALKFDLRSVPNPSRALRQSMTGKHRTLQKELMQDGAFCAELNRAYATIRAAMAEFEQNRGRHPAPDSLPEQPPGLPSACDAKNPATTEPPEGPDDESLRAEKEREHENVLLVSCYCHKGKHRSPAFVESLLQTEEWPKTWLVTAIHRELDDVDETQAPISKNRKGRKVNRRTPKTSASFASSDHEDDALWDD